MLLQLIQWVKCISVSLVSTYSPVFKNLMPTADHFVNLPMAAFKRPKMPVHINHTFPDSIGRLWRIGEVTGVYQGSGLWLW